MGILFYHGLDSIHVWPLIPHGYGQHFNAQFFTNTKVSIITWNRAEEFDLLRVITFLYLLLESRVKVVCHCHADS